MPIIKDHIKDHAVIILASGLSQRLGHSKQLLNKDDQPLICTMIKQALATQPQTVVIVIPQDNPEIVAAIATVVTKLVIENSNVTTVINLTPETGMAHSLYLGIEALTDLENANNSAMSSSVNKRVLILGVDQVLLDSRHLNALLAGKHQVVASSYSHLHKDFSLNKFKDKIVGLPISIDYSLLKQWQTALTGDKGLRHLIRSLPSNQISTVINKQLSYDIDTPEQFAYAKQQRWLDN